MTRIIIEGTLGGDDFKFEVSPGATNEEVYTLAFAAISAVAEECGEDFHAVLDDAKAAYTKFLQASIDA